jgi:hypothetical protein
VSIKKLNEKVECCLGVDRREFGWLWRMIEKRGLGECNRTYIPTLSAREIVTEKQVSPAP